MPNINTPLLSGPESNQAAEEEASEDLERGLHSGAGNDFRHLIDSYPETVIK